MEKEIFHLSTEKAALYYYHYLSIVNAMDNNSRSRAAAPAQGKTGKKKRPTGRKKEKTEKRGGAGQRSSA